MIMNCRWHFEFWIPYNYELLFFYTFFTIGKRMSVNFLLHVVLLVHVLFHNWRSQFMASHKWLKWIKVIIVILFRGPFEMIKFSLFFFLVKVVVISVTVTYVLLQCLLNIIFMLIILHLIGLNQEHLQIIVIQLLLLQHSLKVVLFFIFVELLNVVEVFIFVSLLAVFLLFHFL